MKSQRGMTLVEVLIATAISGLIIGLLGTVIYQFVTVTGRGNDKMTALHDVQNAGYWVSLDGQMASAASGGGELLELIMHDDSTITYALSGTELQRTAGEAQMMIVARNISNVDFDVENRIITMTITSSPGHWGISEERTYRVYLRSTS